MKKMQRVLGLARVGLVAILMTVSGIAWAENRDQTPSSASGSQPTYQPSTYQPTPVPSSNVIGYKPIPNSALEAAITGAIPAPPQAVPAYPAYSAASTPVQVISQASPASAPGSVQGTQAAGQAQLPPAYLTGIVGDGFYTLGRDDVIHIDVRNQPEFSGAFAIGFDGRIQYNYLGDIPVAGLTKYEVQQVLEKLLQQYVRVPVVNVTILAYNSKVVYVIGEVGNPGKFIMRGDAIKLREAILAAGLPTRDASLRRVHVIKPDLEHPDVRVIDIQPILYKGKLKNDVALTTGDIVVVPSTFWSHVNIFLGRLLGFGTRAASRAALAGI